MRPSHSAVLFLAVLSGAVSVAIMARDDMPVNRQVGYFKDSLRNRVFILQFDEPATAEQALELAKHQLNTAGQITMVYIYADYANPIDRVTLAKDYWSATQTMHEPPVPGWQWRYVISPVGDSTFTDCVRAPRDGECR